MQQGINLFYGLYSFPMLKIQACIETRGHKDFFAAERLQSWNFLHLKSITRSKSKVFIQWEFGIKVVNFKGKMGNLLFLDDN